MDPAPLRRAYTGFLLAAALYRIVFRRPPGPLGTPSRPQRRDRKASPETPPQRPPPLRTVRLLGLALTAIDRTGAAERIRAWSRSEPGRSIVFADLEHAVAATRDPLLHDALASADLLLARDRALVCLTRGEARPLTGIVDPAALLEDVLVDAARARRSLFLFGTDAETLDRAARHLTATDRRLRIAGVYAAPPGFERDGTLQSEIARMLRTVRPDIVLVGFPSPVAEVWASAAARGARHGVFIAASGVLARWASSSRPGARSGGSRLSLRSGPPARAARAARRLKALLCLPPLYARHRRDAAARALTERRQAMAALAGGGRDPRLDDVSTTGDGDRGSPARVLR